MRMFVAVLPPEEVLEDLDEFLGPRREAGRELRWATREQWHVTLAFMAAVPERSLDDLIERLARAARKRTPFTARLGGGGAFPDAARAKVLYAGVRADDPEELRRLAVGARAAATKAGAEVGGGRFRPHLTLARSGRTFEATRWLRVLDAYQGPAWVADNVVLVESRLGEGPRGRPRYAVVSELPLGKRPEMQATLR
ncbi:MAG: RNA 2',3'-cyclic phosphodiesterase [Nocardioidaceae bacterium]